MTEQPSGRKLAGMAMIIAWIVLWAVIIAHFAGAIGRWPVLIQGIFYAVAGIVWIVPLKPLLRWMETGRFGGSTNGD